MSTLISLRVKVFTDSAELPVIERMSADPLIKGFTTNPTLLRKAKVQDYREFAQAALALVPDRPFSFEVLCDEWDDMEAQAREIASWGDNVNVKIPITNTRREFSGPLVKRLSADGIQVNVTAILTWEQVAAIVPCLNPATSSYISIFAGRIADTGRDPLPLMQRSVDYLRQFPKFELIWASPRELLNIFHADSIGCHVITVTPDLLAKLPLVGKDLDSYSLETVKMFFDDAQRAGYSLDCTARVRP